MNQQGKKPLQVVNAHCSQFVQPLKQALLAAGFWVFQSFDLRSTRALHEGCTCPHHGTSQCTCELMVLLVYQPSGEPVTLTLDGRDGKTFIFVTDESGNSLDYSTLGTVEESIFEAADALIRKVNWIDAE